MPGRMLAVCAVLMFFGMLLAAQTDKAKPPKVVTGPATALGLDAFSANGIIEPHGAPTTYYVEYGPTTAYGSKTKIDPLGPRIAAYYHESWDNDFGGWSTWLQKSHHKTGGAVNGFVRFAEPSKHDHNHDNGIGTLHLVKYIYPGFHPGDVSPSLYLGGGDPDFRDAKISLHVRGIEFKPNGAELCWWTQSQSNPEVGPSDPTWKRPNWAYTGTTLTDQLLDGKWHKVDYRLKNDTTQWTYGGGTRGYVYGSIDQALRHLNIDFFHLLAYIDIKNPPQGAIDFDELTIAYRNYSLLLPSNGGKLIESPKGGEDPARLTDGWRNGPDRAWKSVANPAGPLEFTWTFAQPVTIERLQLHNHPEWPAKEVEVLAAVDGKNFQPLHRALLPEKGVPNANWMFRLVEKLKAPATSLKLRILSGYRPEHWGLGEVEAFGTGAALGTDNEPYHVNADITGLEPGKTYHYRLVAQNEAGTVTGDDRTFTTPATRKPLTETQAASRITATTAKLEGRLNALGESVNFHFEYGIDAKYGMKTPPQFGGIQITPRTGYSHLTDLTPGTTYHYRLVATNAAGTSVGEDRTFTTATGR